MRRKSLPVVPEAQTRREFLSDVTVVTGMGLLSVCGVGCNTTWTNHRVVLNIQSMAGLLELDTGLYPAIKDCGSYLPIEDRAQGLRVLLIHTLDGELMAFNMSCTHRGADIELNRDKTGFVCNLHKSHFDMGGEVVSGPARRPLKRYFVEEQGTMIHIYLDRTIT